jgi:hypothetical protein
MQSETDALAMTLPTIEINQLLRSADRRNTT